MAQTNILCSDLKDMPGMHLAPDAPNSTVQGNNTDAMIVAKLNASQENPLDALTHGYFSFAGNLLTGSLPAFLGRSQVPDVSQGSVNLQVCSWLEHELACLIQMHLIASITVTESGVLHIGSCHMWPRVITKFMTLQMSLAIRRCSMVWKP